ncbi:MAG TPA: DMT family transporter [Rhodospirillales bacterium]|nr:DMT family transporter [Rhodospirillales bacterium]
MLFDSIPPFLFALIAAFLLAVGGQLVYIGLSTVESRSGTMVSIATSAVIYWSLSPFLLDWSHWSQPAVLLFALAGLIRPSVSANLSVAGIRLLGPTMSSTLSSTAPIFGATLGVFWLGETLTWPIAIGTGGVITAIVLLSQKDTRAPSTWPLWALALPVGAAAVRSLAHVLSKMGMEDIPDPYFVCLVGFSVSAILTILNQFMRKKSVAIQWRNKGFYFFIASGFFFSTAILCLNTALLRGQVVSIIPIIAAAPMFSMLLSIFIFRREKLTARTVFAVFLVVPSVAYIAISK